MEQNKYPHSDKLPLSLVVEELEKDAEFTDKALQILSVEDRGSTHTRWTAVSALISHWLTNRDLNCYINGKLVDDVTDQTVLPVDGDDGAGIKALENWMTISMDELAKLLEQRNLSVPAFLRPCVKVSKAPPPGDDEEQAADAPAAKVEAQRSITKQAVVNAFESIHFTRDRWNRNLGDIKSAPWLEECRVSKGIKGDKSNPSRWNPVLIASELFSKQIKINSLDAVFQIKLKDWLDEWIEVSATFRN